MYEPQHEMQLETTHPSGEEEWYCPTCGRRFLMQWMPDYKKVILEAGDQHAIHTGSKGGLRIAPPSIEDIDEPALSDEMRTALEDVLRDIDFDDPCDTANL